MVAADQDLAVLIPEDRVRRTVPRAMEDLELPIAEGERVAVVQAAIDMAARAEGPERRTDRPEHRREVGRDSVPAHDPLREVVVGRRALTEVLQIWPEPVERRYLGARATGEDLEQADVVHVLMGEDDQP